jgi:hypothetical protein
MSLALVGTSSKMKQTCTRTLWVEMVYLAILPLERGKMEK